MYCLVTSSLLMYLLFMRVTGQVQPHFSLLYFATNSVAAALCVHVSCSSLINEVVAAAPNTEKCFRVLLGHILKELNVTASWFVPVFLLLHIGCLYHRGCFASLVPTMASSWTSFPRHETSAIRLYCRLLLHSTAFSPSCMCFWTLFLTAISHSFTFYRVSCFGRHVPAATLIL